MTSVTIPNSVTIIKYGAFKSCSNLENVYCYAKKFSSIGGDIFKDSNIKYATLHVPSSAISYYQTTDPWSDFGTIDAIEGINGIESVKERSIDIKSAGGFISIAGLANDETVSFFSLDGKNLGTAKSIDGNISFTAKQGTIILARIGKESVKIAVK